MDHKSYYATITQLEKMGASDEYIQGWQGAYMNNPMREETRLSPAYEAGYNDAKAGNTANAGTHLKG